MKTVIRLLALLLLLPAPAPAAPPEEMPALLKSGFEKYAADGPKAAIEGWTKGSAIEASKEALAQANSFRQVEDFYGKYIGYELVRKNQISESSAAYLVIIKYEKGNIFSVFNLYRKPDGGEVVTTFNFHTSAQQIWPASAIYGCGD